jgi:hypothetical protein
MLEDDIREVSNKLARDGQNIKQLCQQFHHHYDKRFGSLDRDVSELQDKDCSMRADLAALITKVARIGEDIDRLCGQLCQKDGQETRSNARLEQIEAQMTSITKSQTAHGNLYSNQPGKGELVNIEVHHGLDELIPERRTIRAQRQRRQLLQTEA